MTPRSSVRALVAISPLQLTLAHIADGLASPKWEESSAALEAIIARVQLMGAAIRPYIPSIFFGELILIFAACSCVRPSQRSGHPSLDSILRAWSLTVVSFWLPACFPAVLDKTPGFSAKLWKTSKLAFAAAIELTKASEAPLHRDLAALALMPMFKR